MKYRFLLTFVVASLLYGCAAHAAAAEKVRLFVLTDIENEPDDAQSMVRLLTYSNQFDIEGPVATTSVHMRDKTSPARIREIVDAYGQVRDNLERHESGWPTVEHLRSVISEGLPQHGMRAVGEGKDSPGRLDTYAHSYQLELHSRTQASRKYRRLSMQMNLRTRHLSNR